MSCPAGVYTLHPLWSEYLLEIIRIEDEPTYWDKLRQELGEGPERPTVPRWVSCPGVNCGHEPVMEVLLAP